MKIHGPLRDCIFFKGSLLLDAKLIKFLLVVCTRIHIVSVLVGVLCSMNYIYGLLPDSFNFWGTTLALYLILDCLSSLMFEY